MSTLPPQTTDLEPHLTASTATGGETQLDERTSRLVADSIALFSAKPSPDIFQRSWRDEAVFADPITQARGSKQYLAQWYGLPAAFSSCQLLAWRLLKVQADEVQYVQKQSYKLKLLGIQKDIVSTVVMKLDQEGKITEFEDRWNHRALPSSSIALGLRRLNALTMPIFVGVPKETKTVFEHRKDL